MYGGVWTDASGSAIIIFGTEHFYFVLIAKRA
jgi:hypothetical protein